MVQVTAGAPDASPTDHRLTVLHAANRAETASVIMRLHFTIAVILLVTLLLVRVKTLYPPRYYRRL